MESVTLKDSYTVRKIETLLAEGIQKGEVSLNSRVLIFHMDNPSEYISSLIDRTPVDTPGRRSLMSIQRRLHRAS
jgi:hydroxymethylglutaryl-CoA reductase